MTAWLHTRTVNDLTGTTADHPPVRVCGDPSISWTHSGTHTPNTGDTATLGSAPGRTA